MSSSASRRGPGRPPAVTAERIATAVLDIGFRDLTFAAVAEKLGVGQATLYRHAANRDELLKLGMDLVIRSTEWPGIDGPWREVMERWARAVWRCWERYPGAVLEASRGIVPPSVTMLWERVGAALVAQGFSARAAVLACDLVFDLVTDNRRGVEIYDAPFSVSQEKEDHVRVVMEREWVTRPLSTDVSVALREETMNAIHAEPFDWFLGKLRIVLSGIEQELAPASPQNGKNR